jgi:hypothetical protein
MFPNAGQLHDLREKNIVWMGWGKVMRRRGYPAYARASQLTFPSEIRSIIAG